MTTTGIELADSDHAVEAADATAAAPRRRLLRRIAAILLPLTLFAGLSAWAVASPVGASPDDDYHMASIWCGAGLRDSLCEAGADASTRRVPLALLETSGCYAFRPDLAASCPYSPSSEMIESDRGNFEGGYPPVYYAAMSVFASADIPTSVIVIRLVNAAIFVGVLSALFALLEMRRRPVLLWGVASLLVPLGMFLVPSVNPSSWAITSAAATLLATLGFLTARTRRRTIGFGIVAPVALLIGAGARSDSAIYGAVALGVAAILGFARTRTYMLRLLLPAALVVVAAVFFLSAGQSSVVDADTFQPGEVSINTLLFENLIRLPELWTGAIGTNGLGWLDTGMYGIVWGSTVFVASALLFWGLQRVFAKKLIGLAILAACLVAIPMYVLVNDRVIVGVGVQPRYIYPLMFMLTAVALLGLRRRLGLGVFQMWVVVATLAIANAFALHQNLRRYITGTDVSGFNLNRNIEWWWGGPVSPMLVWGCGAIAFACALSCAVVLTCAEPAPLAREVAEATR